MLRAATTRTISVPIQFRTSWRSLLLIALLPTAIARAADFDGSLGASTDNVFRGLTQSQGQASVQANGYLTDTHWFGGLTSESVKRARSLPTGVELIGYLGYQQLLSDTWNGALTLRHYDYPGNRYRGRYDYDELSASVSWRQQLVLSVIASPDTYGAAYGPYGRYGRGAAFAAELGGHEPLPYGLSADLGLGYYDLQQQVGAGYAYWSAGLGKQWRAWELRLDYIGTDAEARRLFRSLAGDRLVASVAWFF
jgi:uncharacterized protein (TIGR02001 family)